MYFTLLVRFCSTRWVEDKDVAERAIQAWPAVAKVVAILE